MFRVMSFRIPMYFCVFLRNNLKNTQNTCFFVRLFCFSIKYVWYVSKWKTLKRHISSNVDLFPYIRIFFCVCVLALNTLINTQEIRFWKCRFFSYFIYIMLCMHFCVWYLTIWNTLKTYGFSNFYLFLHIECYICVLGFWYLRSWKIFIIHVSLNVLYYPDIGYIACILAFLYVTSESKKLENTCFW